MQGYPGCHIDSSGTPGGDVAGTIVALGPGCTGRLSVGDRVWANRFALAGGMAEYVKQFMRVTCTRSIWFL